MKLETRIRSYIMLLLTVCLALVSMIFINREFGNKEMNVKSNLANVASLMARDRFVQGNLFNKNSNAVQSYIEKILTSLNDVDMIVIADMTGKRYSHVDPDKIGKYFVGGDEEKVIGEGKSYFSRAGGTLGISLRRFEPIHYQNKQIGFVMVGKLYWKINKMKSEVIRYFLTALFLIVFLSFFPASALSNSIKEELKGFEPNEIGEIYEEKKTIFESIHEGVIAINNSGKITNMNKAAKTILNNSSLEKLKDLGRETLEFGEEEYDREVNLQKRKVFVNAIPVFKNEETIGVVLTLRDSEEVNKRAREITGFSHLIDSLRANIHEFKNKLHIIMGLLELNEIEEAINYIMKLENETGRERFENTNIDDSILLALLTGKLNTARERGIKLTLAEGSNILNDHNEISTSDLIIIVGNIVENAIEACEYSEIKQVEVCLEENNEKIFIQVSDTGEP